MKSRLKRIIHGSEIDLSSPEYSRQRKSKIAATFSIIAALVFLVFVIDDIVSMKIRDVIIDAPFLIFLAAFPLFIRRLKRQQFWTLIVLLILILMIIRLIYSGPASRGGNFIWFLTIPMVSFLMLGRIAGIFPGFEKTDL